LKTILHPPPGVERDALELEKVEVAQAIKRKGMGWVKVLGISLHTSRGGSLTPLCSG